MSDTPENSTTEKRPVTFSVTPMHLVQFIAFLVGGGLVGGGSSLITRPNTEQQQAQIVAQLTTMSTQLADIKLSVQRSVDGGERRDRTLDDHERRIREIERITAH